MPRHSAPTALRIPNHWLKYCQSLGYLLAQTVQAPKPVVHSWVGSFQFKNDEKLFAKTVLRIKQNLWVFRTHQQRYCGDFVIVDMSSPDPVLRPVYLLDLKAGADLKVGGGGAGIQFRNAPHAVEEIAKETQIIPDAPQFKLLSGDRRAILQFLGIETWD